MSEQNDPDDSALKARRDELARRLASTVAAQDPKRARNRGGWAEATKIASEFVAGIVVGVVLGLIIDRVFGTAPFGLVIFLMLGFAAGVLNVLRAQGVVADAGAKLRDDRAGRPDDRDDGAA